MTAARGRLFCNTGSESMAKGRRLVIDIAAPSARYLVESNGLHYRKVKVRNSQRLSQALPRLNH